MNKNILYHRNFNKEVEPIFPFLEDTPPGVKENTLREKGYNINVSPNAVLGAATGAAIGAGIVSHKNKERAANMAVRETNKASISGSYYDQVSNVVNGMSVVFTPISVIYMIKNKGRDFTLDTVETSEMTDEMKLSFRARDEKYFKDIFVSKMYSEMQLAEVEFARRLLKKQINLSDLLTKQASDTSEVDNLLAIDVYEKVAIFTSKFIGNDELEKISSAIADDVSANLDGLSINLKLSRPIEKHAGIISGIKSTLGLNTANDELKILKKQLANPDFLIKHVRVGFLPDRVIFSLNNQLISTLPLTEMNDDGYERFISQDQKYFRNFLGETVKESVRQSQSQSSIIIKTASENIPMYGSAADCLKNSSSHPVLIYLILTEKFGLEWLEFDIATIEEVVKSAFDIDDFSEANKNKIMAIMMANQSDTPFVNAYAFEKAILSLCGKPVDFLAKEKEFINVQDIVFAIDVLDRITPYDDIYDNFSIETFNFIADVLSDKEMYICKPTNIIMSELEPIFTERLNEILIGHIKSKMTRHSTQASLDDEIKKRCEYIADNASIVLKNARSEFLKDGVSPEARAQILENVIVDAKLDPLMVLMVREQVIRNIALDDMLYLFEEELQMQLQKYNIQKPEGSDVVE